MESESLALKYRPLALEQLVGQETNVTVLGNLLKRRISRNIIFYGGHGSSKTTSARIYARGLNCLARTPSGSPCNKCENCKLFFQGRYTDYMEFDAASKSKVEDARDLVNVMMQPPLFGDKRVFTVDECFPSNMLVHLADGTKRTIGSIVKSRDPVDVLSLNKATGQVEVKRVYDWMSFTTEKWVELTLTAPDGTNVCYPASPLHKHITTRGDVYSKDVVVGDVLTGPAVDGSSLYLVTATRTLSAEDSVYGSTMYNISVEDNHTYLTGPGDGVWTNNCHAFSKQAWDSLLKVIEEPPHWLVILFCTTEVDKVRPAIRSRCTELEVKLLNHTTSVDHLRRICQQEGYEYEDMALELISFIAKGHPRDLIKNLEQVSLVGDINTQNTKAAFNLGNITNVVKLMVALAGNKVNEVMDLLQVWDDSPDKIHRIFCEALLYLYTKFYLNARVQINPVLTLIPEGDMKRVYSAYTTLAERLGYDVDAALSSLMAVARTHPVTDALSLRVFFANLLVYIHKHKLEGSLFGAPAKADRRMDSGKQSASTEAENRLMQEASGRRFAKHYDKDELLRDKAKQDALVRGRAAPAATPVAAPTVPSFAQAATTPAPAQPQAPAIPQAQRDAAAAAQSQASTVFAQTAPAQPAAPAPAPVSEDGAASMFSQGFGIVVKKGGDEETGEGSQTEVVRLGSAAPAQAPAPAPEPQPQVEITQPAAPQQTFMEAPEPAQQSTPAALHQESVPTEPQSLDDELGLTKIGDKVFEHNLTAAGFNISNGDVYTI